MCKTKKFLFIIGLAMILSSTAYARVCFLGGGNDFDGDGEPDDNCLSGFVASTSNCPGYSTCAAPKKGAKACLDSGSKFYLPEDCCSNSSLYTSCNTSAGYVCSGTKCTGINADGEEYTACDGECKCDSKYKYDCAALGKIGVGASCGGKYTECKCDLDKFHKCGSNATGSGPTCTDGSVTYHSTCSCPTTGNWTSNLDNCCTGAQDTCTNSSGKIYYECKDNPSATTFGCVCGTTKQSGNAGCINGCTDSSYSYIGSADRVTCGESVSFINGQTGICGNNCHCSPGYYEYSDLCSQQESDVCDALGYTDVTCPDEWLACPFNSSKKKCFSNNCFNYEEFCTDQTANFCATLGYTETSCSGDFIGCPLNANIKKCLANDGATNDTPSDECGSGQAMINGSCQTIYASCSAAGLYTQSECSATGYMCGLRPTTIYTSASGTTASCYTRINALCPLGYATSASSCLQTPDGLSCADGYILAISGDYYSGTTRCGECTCSNILAGGNLQGGCPCTADKPYYVNGACSATCPGHAQGLECFRCDIVATVSPL